MSTTALALVYFVVFGSIGILIGARRGRPVAGFTWAMLLGPVGWLLMLLLPSARPKAGACPHCGGTVPIGQPSCNHCGNAVRWIQGRAFKPSRPVPLETNSETNQGVQRGVDGGSIARNAL